MKKKETKNKKKMKIVENYQKGFKKKENDNYIYNLVIILYPLNRINEFNLIIMITIIITI